MYIAGNRFVKLLHTNGGWEVVEENTPPPILHHKIDTSHVCKFNVLGGQKVDLVHVFNVCSTIIQLYIVNKLRMDHPLSFRITSDDTMFYLKYFIQEGSHFNVIPIGVNGVGFKFEKNYITINIPKLCFQSTQ